MKTLRTRPAGAKKVKATPAAQVQELLREITIAMHATRVVARRTPKKG